jgi:hypothetical protein
MNYEKSIAIKRDQDGNIIEIKTNKGKNYDYEIAKELINQGSIKADKLTKNN